MRDDSPFAPFRNRAFLNYWMAGLAANFGWQIQLVGASWLMIAMGGTASQVAMVQTAVALPVMLMSLPGGALADLVGQRRLVIWSQSLLMVVSILLAAAAGMNLLTPGSLLILTFLIGSGRALYYPGWQTMVMEFFPRAETKAAVAVNSANLNVARSLGPALGGFIVASMGAFLAFVVNAISNVTVILVAWRWPRPSQTEGLPPESFGTAIMAGLRYMLLSPTLVTITLRSFLFNVGAIATLALMPLIARDLLGGGPLTFGMVVGTFGLGGVIGSLSADTVRRRFALETYLAAGHLMFGAAAAVLALSHSLALSAPAGVLAGMGWIYVQVTLNWSIQLSSPRWVVGRTIAIYQTFVFGGNALGSFLWGRSADAFGIAAAMAVPVGMMIVGALLGLILRVHELDDAEVNPRTEWVPPWPNVDMVLSSGPILTTITYRIREKDIPQFLAAMARKRRNRVRDGAMRWTLSRDILDTEIWFERFKVSTWAAAQRLHARRTEAGAQTIEVLRTLHQGSDRPEVHYELVRQPEAYVPARQPPLHFDLS
jgi:MFS family permease